MKLAAFLFLIVTMISCGGSGGGGSSGQSQEDSPNTGGSTDVGNITFDTQLTNSERLGLDNSTKALSTYQIDGSKIRRFNEIFGGSNSRNVLSYLDTRVNYALSAATDITTRVVTPPAFTTMLEEPQTLASNQGPYLWYTAVLNEPLDVKFEINNDLVDINSTRVGVMQFGQIFGTLQTIEQAITLVHEARHSDCTGGALASDLERLKNGQAPLNLLCGHLHTVCPTGHPYEGSAACDSKPWGAYIVHAIYAAAVASTCTSCSETDKQVAESYALDALSRPLYNVNDLLDGEFGPPDMSSSNQIK